MIRIHLCIVLSLMTVLMFGCQALTGVTKPAQEEEPPFVPIDPQSLDEHARLALTAIDVAVLGQLDAFPYVRLGPDSRIQINNGTDYAQFQKDDWLILEDRKESDGLRTLSVLDRAVDTTGKIDLSYNTIVYTPVVPNTEEKTAVSDYIAKGYQSVRVSKNDTERAALKKSAVAFQKSRGLAPDGIVGKKTIAAMTKDMRILDVETLTTDIFYPENPRHEIYIMLRDIADADPDRFSNSFENLSAVRENAIALEAFKNEVRKQKKFVVYLFFYDRVDPGSSIQIGFSKYEKGRSRSKSAKLYNTPGNWPVIVWPFNIKRIDSFGNLYVNVYIDDKAVAGYRLR